MKNLFIIGSRRSGTTWTLSLLANHPEMVGIAHTHLIKTLTTQQQWREDKNQFRGTIVGIEGKKANIQEYVTDEEFYGLCRQLTDQLYGKALLRKPGARLVIESQPENINFLSLLKKLYPDAYVLHVIRDPRAVYASVKSAAVTWSSRKNFETHADGFCQRWRKEIQHAREMSESLTHYKEVRYEELQNNGLQVLQDIFLWLGVESKENLAEASIDACKIEKLRETSMMPEGFFRSGQNEGWRSELTTTDVVNVEYLLWDMMDELEYRRVNRGTLKMPGSLRRFYVARSVYRGLSSLFERLQFLASS